jgi:HD-like signal output (HDOD) protein
MKEVNIKYIQWDNDNEELQDAIQKAMQQYGYGYTHVIHMENNSGVSYMLLADEHVNVDDELLELIYQHYQGSAHTPRLEYNHTLYLLNELY